MRLRTLRPEAHPQSWGITDLYHGYTEYSALPENVRVHYGKILRRDNHTCQYCGFRSELYQEIHHINHNHADFDVNNLVCACTLCHRSFHLNALHIAKAAELIFFPELTQAEVNHLCRALAVAKYRGHDVFTGQHPIAKHAFDTVWTNNMAGRISPVRNIMGDDMLMNLSAFAQILIDLQQAGEGQGNQDDSGKHYLDNFKIFHFPDSLQLQTQYWADAVFPPFAEWDKYAEILKIN